ncbi:MAG: glycosyltransferase family 4 protein [Dokdonia sp.]
MKLLIIGSTWVEPRSTAAGSRMLQLLEAFDKAGWELTFATAAKPSEHAFDLGALGIKLQAIQLNDDSFDVFVQDLQPDIVLFDRYITEEQYGWRVYDRCPNAMRVLDTEDLHCLRKARATAVTQDRNCTTQDLFSDVAKREIASIYRCDLTLMISEYEIELLQHQFQVPLALLHYVPFLVSSPASPLISFEDRAHFTSIGNFLHPPNWDATLYLKKAIWPIIRKALPKASVEIYGAYPSDKVFQLHNEAQGFLIKGRAPDAHKVIQHAKVLLAPLRFGAGLKGKLIDAMQCGTPSVTTSIGAEGMYDTTRWCGRVEDEPLAFAKAAIALYTSPQLWLEAQRQGVEIVNTRFQKQRHAPALIDKMLQIQARLSAHRQANFTGQMLHFHQLRASKYMSKWIALKNKQ